LPLSDEEVRSSFTICGRTDATQSRPYPDWVMAVRGWRTGEAEAARLVRSANPTSMQTRAKGG